MFLNALAIFHYVDVIQRLQGLLKEVCLSLMFFKTIPVYSDIFFNYHLNVYNHFRIIYKNFNTHVKIVYIPNLHIPGAEIFRFILNPDL